MTVAIGLGVLLVLGGATYPSVHRRQVRSRNVRRVRAALASWLTSDLAAPLQPGHAPQTVAGFDTAGAGSPPDLPAPAGRRFHFELTAYEIRRAS